MQPEQRKIDKCNKQRCWKMRPIIIISALLPERIPPAMILFKFKQLEKFNRKSLATVPPPGGSYPTSGGFLVQTTKVPIRADVVSAAATSLNGWCFEENNLTHYCKPLRSCCWKNKNSLLDVVVVQRNAVVSDDMNRRPPPPPQLNDGPH